MARATRVIGAATTALLGAVLGTVLLAAPAAAQNSACGDIQKTLAERQSLIQQANAGADAKAKRMKLTAQQACGLFGKLVTNGQNGMKFIEANKDWCSIPDQFAEGFKADHERVAAMRTKICGAAAQQAQMEKKMRAQAAQNQGGGLLGGPGLTGNFRVPQGAL
jgi:hypothetical protein